jgi:hypothetical protein
MNHEFGIPDVDQVNAQLLVQLAPRRCQVGLPGLALASGKLPESPMAFAIRTLTDQQSMPARHNRSHDTD